MACEGKLGGKRVGTKVGRAGWLLAAASAFLLLTGCSGHPMMSQRDLDFALIRASEAGHVDEMRQLLRRGANMNAMDKDGWTPYLAASSLGRLDAMHLLKTLGAKTQVDEGALALQ